VDQLIPLLALQPGEVAVVAEIVGGSDWVDRLREMGLGVGVDVEMLQGGSPCIVRLNGHTLGLRSEDLATVLVRLREVPR